MKYQLTLLLIGLVTVAGPKSGQRGDFDEDYSQGYHTFQEWCEHRDELPRELRATVEAVIETQKISAIDNRDTRFCGEILELLKESSTLRLSHRELTDIRPLSTMSWVEKLFLHNNNIVDLSPIASLSKLTHLDVSGNRLNEISSIASLTNLESIRLNSNPIGKLDGIQNLTNLRELMIAGLDPVEEPISLLHLSSLVSLERLTLSGDNFSDIDAISSLHNLIYLRIHGKNISDISFLNREMNRLNHIEVTGTEMVVDITPIACLRNIEYINFNGNKIENIDPISSLENLSVLLLSHNRISDLSPIRNLENLREIHLDFNRISDISPLLLINSLEVITPSSNPIENEELLQEFQPYVYVRFDGNSRQ